MADTLNLLSPRPSGTPDLLAPHPATPVFHDPVQQQAAPPAANPLNLSLPGTLQQRPLNHTQLAHNSLQTPIISLLTRLGQAHERSAVEGQQAARTGGFLGALRHDIQTPLGFDWGTLLHGDLASGQYQHDTAELARQWQHLTPEQYAALPGWERSANEFAIQSLYDPTTFLGVGGVGRAASEELSTHAMPATMRAAGALEQRGLLPEHLQRAASSVHDFFTAGGPRPAHLLRTLAQKYGPEGVLTYRRLYGLSNARDTIASDFQHSLSQGLSRAVHGLTAPEYRQMENALHEGSTATLPPKLQAAAQTIRQYDDAIPYVLGSGVLRRTMQAEGYSLPNELQRFDVGGDYMENQGVAPRPRNVVKASMRRQNHVPIPHDEFAALQQQFEDGQIDEPTYSRKMSELQHRLGVYRGQRLSTRNVQFLRREADAHPEAAYRDANGNLPPDYVARRMAVWNTSFRRAGQQLANADLQRRLAQRYGTDTTVRSVLQHTLEGKLMRRNEFPDWTAPQRGEPGEVAPPEAPTGTMRSYRTVPRIIKDYFSEEPEPQRNVWQEVGHSISEPLTEASRVSRGALFMSPTQHPLRILSLLAAHAPERIPAAVANLLRARLGLPSLVDAENAVRARMGQPLLGGGSAEGHFASVFGKARAAGAVGVRAGSTAGTNEFQRMLTGDEAPQFHEEGVPDVPPHTRIEHAVANWYEGVGNFIWHGADPAMKKALFDKYVGEGMEPEIAAHEVQKDMVNYERASPAIRAAAVFSWFPTWRTLMPVAVLRALGKNPHLFTAAARIDPALVGGISPGTQFTGNQPYKLGTSASAEAAQLVNAPEDYIRGSLNPQAHLGMYGVQLATHVPERDARYWLNYQPPVRYAAGQLPGLNLTGYGYHETPQQELRYQLLGVEPQHPGKTIAGLLSEIHDAQQAGDTAKLQTLRQEYSQLSRQHALTRDIAKIEHTIPVMRAAGNMGAVTSLQNSLQRLQTQLQNLTAPPTATEGPSFGGGPSGTAPPASPGPTSESGGALNLLQPRSDTAQPQHDGPVNLLQPRGDIQYQTTQMQEDMPNTTPEMQRAFQAVAPYDPLVTSVMHGIHEGPTSGPNEDPHYAGRAVDVGAFGGVDVGDNEATATALAAAIRSHQFSKIGTLADFTDNPQWQALAQANGVDLFEDDQATGASGPHVHLEVAP